MARSIDLFISHNNADKPFAEQLATAVEQDSGGSPIRVFLDKWDIQPGANIPIELERALDASRHIALVISPESLQSEWVTLERSTAMAADPSGANRRLVPLLRRDAALPGTLATLNYIDFRRDQDFATSLQRLVRFLRGVPEPRGGGTRGVADLAFQEDAALLHRHRVIFDRPAFRTSCIHELHLDELREALDDSSMALATGRLYARSGRPAAEFPPADAYRLPEFRDGIIRIRAGITDVKRRLSRFERLVGGDVLGAGYRRDFWFVMQELLRRAGENEDEVGMARLAVEHMDGIDDARNTVLAEVNALLQRCDEDPFALIELSSVAQPSLSDIG